MIRVPTLPLPVSVVCAPSMSDVGAALDSHILPGRARFKRTPATLACAASDLAKPKPPAKKRHRPGLPYRVLPPPRRKRKDAAAPCSSGPSIRTPPHRALVVRRAGRSRALRRAGSRRRVRPRGGRRAPPVTRSQRAASGRWSSRSSRATRSPAPEPRHCAGPGRHGAGHRGWPDRWVRRSDALRQARQHSVPRCRRNRCRIPQGAPHRAFLPRRHTAGVAEREPPTVFAQLAGNCAPPPSVPIVIASLQGLRDPTGVARQSAAHRSGHCRALEPADHMEDRAFAAVEGPVARFEGGAADRDAHCPRGRRQGDGAFLNVTVGYDPKDGDRLLTRCCFSLPPARLSSLPPRWSPTVAASPGAAWRASMRWARTIIRPRPTSLATSEDHRPDAVGHDAERQDRTGPEDHEPSDSPGPWGRGGRLSALLDAGWPAHQW